MKRFLLAAAMVAASVGVAHADPFANMYGNTITITGADGKASKAFINPDMTWERHMPDGSVSKGSYAWKDADTACFTATDPAPKPGDAPACAKMGPHNVGDTWTDKDASGSTETFALTAGR